MNYPDSAPLPEIEFLANAQLHLANISSVVEQAKIDAMRSNDVTEANRYSVSYKKGPDQPLALPSNGTI